MSRPAIFLDRDGVINANRAEYVRSWSDFDFLPGSLDALRRLAATPWPIVVVTNQSMVGRGLVEGQTLATIHRHMVDIVRHNGGRIDAVYCCPHDPAAGCDCRKPKPGLLHRASTDLSIDLRRSVLIGDAASDVVAARAAGCLPILVRTGRGGPAARTLRHTERDCLAFRDLPEAADWVLRLATLDPLWAQATRRPEPVTSALSALW